MSQERITLIITSNKSLGTKVLSIPKSFFMLASFLFVLGTLLLTFVVFDYSQLLLKDSRGQYLKAQNKDLKEQLTVFSEKMDAVQVDLEKINRFSRKLKKIALNEEGSEEEQIELSLGKPLIEEENSDERDPALANPAVQSMDALDEEIRQRREGKAGVFPVFRSKQEEYSFVNPLSRADLTLTFEKTSIQAKKMERDLTLLFEKISSKRDLLSATPSVRPTGGWLSSGFGYRRDPFTGRSKLHKGLDFAANIGTPVYAPADGIVSFAGREGGYGKIVSIDHGYGVVTRFAHNSRLHVKTGQRVKRWDMISEVGNTGRSSGPHLHYEVRVNGAPVDPEGYILSN